MAPAPLSPAETSFYASLFSQYQESGTVPGASVFNLLVTSDVPQATLGEIWALADPEDKGHLDAKGWTMAMRLIAVAQRGGDITRQAGDAPCPRLPVFKGHAPPAPSRMNSVPQQPSSTSSALGLNPPLTPEDLAKFKRHFSLAGPVGGKLTSDKATAIFLKSKLPSAQLGQIWNLADTQDRGSLDQADFIIGMYFIQGVMSGKITTLPPTLPPGLYEIASDGTPSRNMSASPAPIPRQSTGQQSNLAPIPRQATGQQQYQQPTSPIAPNMTGGRFPSQPMQPNVTGGSFNNNFSPSVPQSGFASAFAPPTSSTVPWDVSPAEKASSDKFFDGLDKSGRGILEGDVAVPFMLESKLSEVVLAAVWDLADVRKEGNLTKDEFAVAMYLIKGKLAGRELPEVLPASLVPPSLRNETNAPAQQQQPSATRDLFDAFGDSPPSTPAPAAASSAFSSNADNAFGMSAFGAPAAPEKDLMGDDDNPFSAPAPSLAPPTPAPRSAMSTPQPPPAPPSHSSRSPAPPPPELTKLRTEHGTLSSSVSNLQTTGLDLENQTLEHNKEIMDLQAKLISLRSTFESENGNVEKLRKKANEQAEEMKTMSQDMIRAESELSGLRQEKDALDGQIMRDREDVREMKRRMVEIGEETIKMKAAVEKVKKEARQQKGLVTITKKQLSTSEGEREKTTRELEDVEKGVGLEDLQQPQASPFDSFTPASTSSASAFFSSSNPTLQTASHIPLPETPARILSPTASIKSNNPFDRFVTSPAPPPSSLPSSSPAARTEALSHEPAKPIKDLAEAVESGEAPTSPSTSRDVNGEEHSTTHVLPEPIEHVKDLAVEGITAAGMALAGVGAAIFGGGETEVEKEEKREGEQEKAMEEGVAEGVSGTGPGGKDASFGAFDDSFGGDMPSSDASNAPVAGQVDDAGFPVAASSTAQADFGGFDDGFDDGFEPVGAAPSQADGPGARAPEGVRSPSEIPFDEGAGAFDSSFGQQEFVPVATFENDQVPHSNTELSSTSATPTSPFDEDESSRNPISAADSGPSRLDADSSDDDSEDEGPEDLDAPRPADAYANKGKSRDVSETEKATGKFPALETTGLPSAGEAAAEEPLKEEPTTKPFGGVSIMPAGAGSELAAATQRRAAPPPPPRKDAGNASGLAPPPMPPRPTSSSSAVAPIVPPPATLTSTFSQDAFGASPFDNDADESSSPFDTIPSNTAQQPSAPSGSFDDTFPIPPPASTSVTQHTSQPSFSSSSSVSQYANPPGIVLGAPTKAFEVDNALLPSNPTPINTTNLPSHQPTASFSSAGEGAKSPAIANFDDDFDSDFDVVPSANGSSAPPPPQASSPNVSQHQPKQASSGGDDFGFDAFDNDFDAVPTGNPSSSLPAPSQQQQSSTLSAFPPSTSNDPYKVDPSFADFDSAFGPTATSTSSSSRPAPPTNNFSFDDAFDAPSSFFAPHGSPPGPPPGQSAAPTSPPRQSEPQQQYAPPAGPPPPSFAASTAAAPPPTPERPALPSRKTEADSDDIPDVKKLVGMGFSRSQALNALEISNYNLQGAIDHLVGGA